LVQWIQRLTSSLQDFGNDFGERLEVLVILGWTIPGEHDLLAAITSGFDRNLPGYARRQAPYGHLLGKMFDSGGPNSDR